MTPRGRARSVRSKDRAPCAPWTLRCPTATVEVSKLRTIYPPEIGPPNPQDWGRALPPSTDPRFLGPPGDDNTFLYYMARAGINHRDGPPGLIQAAHDVCCDLAQGTGYIKGGGETHAAPGAVDPLDD